MLKRSHIRHFLALVDAGSFTNGAHRIRVTQPTLSAGIADLERAVGTPLVIRGRKGIRLTEAGGAFLPIARDLEHRFRLADGFGRPEQESRSTMRIGCLRTISGVHLEAIMASLTDEYVVELVEGTDYELRTALAADRLDFVLTILRESEGFPNVATLLEEPYSMMVSAHHHLADAGCVSPLQLASEVMIARRACEALDDTSRFFTRSGVRPRFALKSENDDRCLRMVAAGVGITTAPLSLAISGVQALSVQGYDLRRQIGAVFSSHFAEAGRSRVTGAFEMLRHKLAV